MSNADCTSKVVRIYKDDWERLKELANESGMTLQQAFHEVVEVAQKAHRIDELEERLKKVEEAL